MESPCMGIFKRHLDRVLGHQYPGDPAWAKWLSKTTSRGPSNFNHSVILSRILRCSRGHHLNCCARTGAYGCFTLIYVLLLWNKKVLHSSYPTNFILTSQQKGNKIWLLSNLRLIFLCMNIHKIQCRTTTHITEEKRNKKSQKKITTNNHTHSSCCFIFVIKQHWTGGWTGRLLSGFWGNLSSPGWANSIPSASPPKSCASSPSHLSSLIWINFWY